MRHMRYIPESRDIGHVSLVEAQGVLFPHGTKPIVDTRWDISRGRDLSCRVKRLYPYTDLLLFVEVCWFLLQSGHCVVPHPDLRRDFSFSEERVLGSCHLMIPTGMHRRANRQLGLKCRSRYRCS